SKELDRFAASGFAPGPPPPTHRRPGKNGRIGLSSSFYNKHLKTPVSESQWETGEARVITATASAPADRPFANVLFDFVRSSTLYPSLRDQFFINTRSRHEFNHSCRFARTQCSL